MKRGRWIDHLPPWLALGTVLSTGACGASELLAMAFPLLAALLVESMEWQLRSWQRPLELVALLAVAGMWFLRVGLLPGVVLTLFLLCGIRLALPRKQPQRRQVLFMSFLIWLTTALATPDPAFLAWAILWTTCTACILMQQNWEAAGAAIPYPLPAPPLRRTWRWIPAILLLGTLFFLGLPRLTTRLRVDLWGPITSQAGLSTHLDLGHPGPILPNQEAILRIQLPVPIHQETVNSSQASLSLLKGLALEDYDGRRWNPSRETPLRPWTFQEPEGLGPSASSQAYDMLVAPSLEGLLPLPYGQLTLMPPRRNALEHTRGGALRWAFPPRRSMTLGFLLNPESSPQEAAPTGIRRRLLTAFPGEGKAAERWSRSHLSGNPPARICANELTAALQRFRYTLDNPSGGASHPLEDFLERTQAGHCEYFASALALMLRSRDIPARVVNGYRLGAWIPEGGYFLVTQNDAHSWVEYYDEDIGQWQISDPTPPGARPWGAQNSLPSWRRWADLMRYRWDRYVIHFSGGDQSSILNWIQTQTSTLRQWTPPPAGLIVITLVGLAGAGWYVLRHRLRSWNPFKNTRNTVGPQDIRPLLKRLGKRLPPLPGETARHWLVRLARLRPDRRQALLLLADETDAVLYGHRPPSALRRQIQEELRHWKG